jgi:maleylpyruvate isomerase
MKLYDYWRSSSAWRVRIALAFKGIRYQRQAVNLVAGSATTGDQHQAGFRAMNPLAQVPVLELDAGEAGGSPAFLTQSMAILEFLEERFPEPPLLPAGALARARVRQLSEMVNAGMQPLQNLSTTEHVRRELAGDPGTWVRHFMVRGLGALETIADTTAGVFLVGDALSFADLYLVPQLYAARRFGVDLRGFPVLLRVEAACAPLPAFIDAHADRQPDRPAAPVP